MKTPGKYRIKLAFETYRVGQIIYPTGLWRGELLARGFIEEEKPDAADEPVSTTQPQTTQEPPLRKFTRKQREAAHAGDSL